MAFGLAEVMDYSCAQTGRLAVLAGYRWTDTLCSQHFKMSDSGVPFGSVGGAGVPCAGDLSSLPWRRVSSPGLGALYHVSLPPLSSCFISNLSCSVNKAYKRPKKYLEKK